MASNGLDQILGNRSKTLELHLRELEALSLQSSTGVDEELMPELCTAKQLAERKFDVQLTHLSSRSCRNHSTEGDQANQAFDDMWRVRGC